MNISTNGFNYDNVTIISDDINGLFWNDGPSTNPEIAIDNLNNIHAVWSDGTDGSWGSDDEILYINCTTTGEWSVPLVISDGFNDIFWNDGVSNNPDIIIDSTNSIHVVWEDSTNGLWGNDTEIMYSRFSYDIGWTNATVISDGFNNIFWNNDSSVNPKIAIDSKDKIHVIWVDYTNGLWGTDTEIMHVSFTETTGWSNITLISDEYGNNSWNDGNSWNPAIAIDKSDNIHIIWEDDTDGIWGGDREIMYKSYEETSGWSNVSIISDGHNHIYWNYGYSYNPAIAIDSQNEIHVVWEDTTDSPAWWGYDTEIMYSSYTASTGWTLPIVISDGYNDIFWNDGPSYNPDISVDSRDIIHVVWEDFTDGIWGFDTEIMYAYCEKTIGWSNATVISDGFNNVYWNDGGSYDVSIIAKDGNAYVVWDDTTDGIWGYDTEIMYTRISIPTITITSPNLTDTWTIGKSQSIYWTSEGNISNVKIELYNISSLVLEINASTINDGEYFWTLPSDLDLNTLYKIKITDISNPAIYDYSDFFEITTRSSPSRIPGFNVIIVIGISSLLLLYYIKKMKK
ncbi:MAG: Ser-Thr-rich GPI-anchored membrane family protein [Promethearchaeota archaeon]